VNIFELKIWRLSEYLLRREFVRQQIQHVADTNAYAANAGTPTTLLRVNRGAIC
jgi:hypothetical protein